MPLEHTDGRKSRDPIVDKYLDKYRHLPQFKKVDGKKFRFCKLCGKQLDAGEAFRAHMFKHQ